MSEELTTRTRAHESQWRHFVEQHPQGNIFQTPEMAHLLASVRQYQPITLFATLGDQTLVGVLLGVIQRERLGPVAMLSSRTVIWGGPLVLEDAPIAASTILDALLQSLVRAVRSKSIYIQFRNQFDLQHFSERFQARGFKYEEHLNYLVDTSDPDQVRRNLSQSKWRQIQKSLKAGCQIIEPKQIAPVKQFFEILQELYATKARRPLPAWSLFESFFQQSLENRLGKYFLIEYQGRIVGGTMCPITPDRTIYEWYVCGKDQDVAHIYPSVLATWAPIEYAARQGLKCFDFLGAGKPDEDYGVREFKARFGGQQVNYGRFQRINQPILYQVGRLGLRAWGRLR